MEKVELVTKNVTLEELALEVTELKRIQAQIVKYIDDEQKEKEGSGVYYEGSPKYVRDYIKREGR